ncbi:MAG: hypothetical protein CO189_03060 [candidate division Zixibacteria bacterium CG_4_9_14_3_um_filter_46_8]|nr:MAG: hypothetical protein CO189_03060 [candidate division Zixibacteria bacterium CG_4_9_14_3_um_filter_46_8]
MISKPKKPNRTYYEDFVKGLSSSNVKRVYVLAGKEEFLKFRAQKLLLAKLIDPATRDFNYDCMAAAEVTAGDVIAACNTYPIGAGRRVVRLTGASKTSPSFRNQLAGYIHSIPDNTTLIMNFGELSTPLSKFNEAIAEYGVLLDCRPPFANRIQEYVKSFFAEFELIASREAIQTVMDVVGTDLGELYNEIRKLWLALGISATITPDHIRQYARAGSGNIIEEYRDSLGKRNLSRAILIANSPLLRSESALTTIFMISNMFKDIYSSLGPTKSDSYRSFPQSKVQVYISNFTKSDVEKVFSLLFYAEWEAKLNPTPSQQILLLLSYYICEIGKYDGANPFPSLTKLN